MLFLHKINIALCCTLAFFLTTCGSSPVVDVKQTIIAIGDMHGDYDSYSSLMLASGLMDKNGDWSGENTIFVQTGDIPDRGPDTRKIIESLQKLEQQAPQHGGQVIPLVGNHEAMNMVGDLRYTHPGEFEAFVDENSPEKRPDDDTPLGKIEHQHAWSPNGYIGEWVSENLVVVKVQDYLFAHGGFSQEYSSFTLDEINDSAQSALLRQDWSKESILRDNLGPLWYRGNVRGRKDVEGFSRESEIIMVLDRYNATHIIVGHTRNEDGIKMSSDGRLIQIDTGASAVYGGVPSYLRIEDGKIYAHTLDGFEKLN